MDYPEWTVKMEKMEGTVLQDQSDYKALLEFKVQEVLRKWCSICNPESVDCYVLINMFEALVYDPNLQLVVVSQLSKIDFHLNPFHIVMLTLFCHT